MSRIKISKETEKRWLDRISWLQSTDFSKKEDKAAVDGRISRARKDYGFFVSEYFSHLARVDSADFHIETAEIIKRCHDIRLLLEWARGHAKSTHASLLIPIWLLIQEIPDIHFMVLVSKSQDMAIRLLSDLQAELQYNERLIRDFGAQVMEGNWTEGEFVTKGGCKFLALGRGQSPRGIKNRGRRPDYIVIDDIDDDEMVRNPKRVKEIFEWVLTALFGAMEGGRGRFILVGNRIGKDSVLAKFAMLDGIKHLTVNMLNKKGQPSWPQNYSLKEIVELRKLMGERRFQKEYMNNPITEGTIFLQKQIRFGKILPLKDYRTLVCYTDPSFKDSTTADYKATMLVGKTKQGEYHLIKAFADQTSVTEMVRWHYEINNYIDGKTPTLYYMEANFLQDLLLDEFKKVGRQVGHQIPIRGDKRKKVDKFARIEAMQPLFERHLVIINEKEKDSNGVRVLIEQLLMFEKGSKTHDDAPDALESAIFMLNNRARTATAEYAVGFRASRHF